MKLFVFQNNKNIKLNNINNLYPVNGYKKVLRLLELNPDHPSLKLHKLKGKFYNKHAVSITYSYRIIFAFAIVESGILLINVGHHDEVY